MRRYWIEQQMLREGQVDLSGDVYHHIIDVCRQQVGSKFEVLTEEGKAYFVEVTHVSKKNALAKVLDERTIPPLPTPHIHLALSLSRFHVMDAVIEKAVEMGIQSVHPFFSDFSFLRKGEKLSSNKIERWEKIVRSATQQSGRGELMSIAPAVPLESLLKTITETPQSFGIFAYEGDSTQSIKSYLNARRGQGPAQIQNIWLIVGSEGGFSYQEVQELKNFGLEPVTIGAQVLRVETACIALTSAIKYEFDLMN